MSDFCLKNEAYTVCVARLFLRVAPVRSLLYAQMRCIFHSTICPLVRLDNLDTVPSQLMRCIFHSTTCPLVGKLRKVFSHSYLVVSIGHGCQYMVSKFKHCIRLFVIKCIVCRVVSKVKKFICLQYRKAENFIQ